MVPFDSSRMGHWDFMANKKIHTSARNYNRYFRAGPTNGKSTTGDAYKIYWRGGLRSHRLTRRSVITVDIQRSRSRRGHAAELFYVDLVGAVASVCNRFLLGNRMPSRQQMLLWDRVMVPLSRLFDPYLLTGWERHSLG